MKFRRRQQDQLEIPLISLIDIVFILLLFFVVTTSFTSESQLSVELPQALSGVPLEAGEEKKLEIMISADSSYQLNGQPVAPADFNTLMSSLRSASNNDNSLPLIISADSTAPYQAVVVAMDVASKLGFARLRITTLESADGPQP